MLKSFVLCGSLLLGGALQCALAGPIGVSSATFNMSGIITVTTTSITWNSDQPGNASQFFTLSAATTPFTTELGQNTVDNLNISTEPVGSLFPPQPFIAFDVNPSLPALNLTFIYSGTGGTAGCTAGVAVNDTCTISNGGLGSPFTFTDDPGGTSDAKFVFSGVSSDGLDIFTAVFTSQFTVPYQTVLADLASTGSVSDSYSATVFIEAVPEPGSFLLAGLGLAALVSYRKYRKA